MLNHCLEQIKKQTVKPDMVILVNYPPVRDKVDLTMRVRNGIRQAREEGMDWLIVMEDDDFYDKDHISRYVPFMRYNDFIGDPFSYYYNLSNRTWERFHHHGRASLFTTAFRISALDDFPWPLDDEVFLDIPLWKHAKRKRCKFIDTGAVGIKGHGEGITGGKGHRMRMKNYDLALNFLRSKVDEQSFEFYRKIADKL